jgi:hypothetical protein
MSAILPNIIIFILIKNANSFFVIRANLISDDHANVMYVEMDHSMLPSRTPDFVQHETIKGAKAERRSERTSSTE